MSESYSIIKPVGFTIASCGYCGGESSAHVYGAFAYRLTCKDYQDLLDQGWRRFGLYLYLPNLRDSCCRQYTIRLNTSKFTPSKGQRRTVARLNRFIKNQYVPLKISRESMAREDTNPPEEHSPSPEPALSAGHGARRKSISPPFGSCRSESAHADFVQNIHAADMDKIETRSDWRQFKVVLEPATFTQEKYDLYCQYQQEIHRVPSSMLSRESFDGSITRTPLMTETTIPEHERHGFVGFGTYHHCYYIDGKLVAVSVLDILPRCISSGHFYYDPSLSTLSLGRYSTLREIALVQEIKAIPGFEAMEYYTMGHYVSSAPKTHFKATYHPSYLLDPETYGWVPFERCIHLLQSKRYFSFSASELFNPRVKGLLITMAAEKRAREKTTRENSSAATTVKPTEHELADFCPMDTGSPTAGIEVTDIREQHQVQPQQHGHGSGLVSNDEEGYRSRKRPQDGSPVPSEYTRGGKRPSLTPPPLMSSLPLPGMMNPDDVSEQDLAQLVLFKGDKAMMLTDFEAFKTDEKVSKAMREYYAAVGPILAPRMLIFAQ